MIVPNQNEVRIRKTIVDFPELVKQWHPSKNGKLTPDKFLAGSNKRIWWKCSEEPDREWMAIINDRTGQKTGCPYCSKGWTVEKVRLFIKSLVDMNIK